MMFMVPNKFKKETLPRTWIKLNSVRNQQNRCCNQGLAAGQTMKRLKISTTINYSVESINFQTLLLFRVTMLLSEVF
jgi:predicted transcriptional regulator